jgi:aspartate kinase
VLATGEQAGVHTDAQHGNARLTSVQPGRIAAELAAGRIVLVTGFQGISPDGGITTLGRFVADASAVAVAAGLGQRTCEIFTDVAAMFTADPRVVPHAQRLDTLRHDEMLEMVEAGAGVLQPRAVELALAHCIDVHLRSGFSDEPGTWIRSVTSAGEIPAGAESAGVRAALEEAGIEARFLTTTPGRLSVYVDAALVHDAVRLLHRLFLG